MTKLSPIVRVYNVAGSGGIWLEPEEITAASVGQKARGLACLPPPWTVPFLVISHELLNQYRSSTLDERKGILEKWLPQILRGCDAVGIFRESAILVRSSAVFESLNERGRYHSNAGTVPTLPITLSECLDRLSHDTDLKNAQVHLVLQIHVSPVSGKGHLSNERHCYEEARDWLGQFEAPDQQKETFTINLRNWRTKGQSEATKRALQCNLKALVSKVLHVPAWWGYRLGARLHFEWVWDGRQVYLVQVDEAREEDGIDPTTPLLASKLNKRKLSLHVLKPIADEHAQKYHKIKNVYTYLKLRLPITDLFVLDDRDLLARLREGSDVGDLRHDLEQIVQGSLVIRTDLFTDDLSQRQLLPRTNEVRDVETAITFIRTTLQRLYESGVRDQIAFIFHNFLPAIASAFAYAAPGHRKVWIEALWGLPEGLYYNAHDKIEVDTLAADLTRLTADRVAKFAIVKRPRFKRYFVAPDVSGNWVVKTVCAPWDWRLSVQKDEWIRTIALDTRRIAEEEGRSVSVMWFIGLPPAVSPKPIFPWYHEPFDMALVARSAGARRKTPFDESKLVCTRADVESLRKEAALADSRIRQIRIEPREEPLLRDKNLLRTIGALAKGLDAVILLEGSTLSHAYYQLMQTEAVVEVVHPFESNEDKREFNKLVRDHIPENISRGGETVRVSRLQGDLLLRALREKLVEESYEALDAKSHDAIIEELADVQEVIDAVLKQLGVTHREVQARQRAKRTKAGGFQHGYVLVETTNPAPDSGRSKEDRTIPLSLSGGAATDPPISEQPLRPTSSVLARWIDKRDHPSATENILNLVVSLVREQWSADSTEIAVGADTGEVIRARLTGTRSGATLQLEISIYVPSHQLDLLKGKG